MMGKTKTEGFTLIEVILFLAISALMMVGVFVGVSGSINRQRYDDASATFLDFMQSQYNLVDNVRNNRPDNRSCNSGGINSSSDDGRGTSDCTVVGRLIKSTDGKNITSRPVYSHSDPPESATTESEVLDGLILKEAPNNLTNDDEDFTLAWQTQVYTDKDNKETSRRFAVLIVRLPTNGLIRTYIAHNTTNLSDFWNSSILSPLNICVETSGLTGAPATGVAVFRYASNSNGVQFIPAGDGIC